MGGKGSKQSSTNDIDSITEEFSKIRKRMIIKEAKKLGMSQEELVHQLNLDTTTPEPSSVSDLHNKLGGGKKHRSWRSSRNKVHRSRRNRRITCRNKKRKTKRRKRI